MDSIAELSNLMQRIELRLPDGVELDEVKSIILADLSDPALDMDAYLIKRAELLAKLEEAKPE